MEHKWMSHKNDVFNKTHTIKSTKLNYLDEI